jgi:fructuronate reductase
VDEKGNPIEVSDPLAAQLRAACDQHKGDPAATVSAVVSIQQVFGSDLPGEQRFVQGVTQWLTRFYAKGVLASVREAFQ